jgi:hypothetical protein
MDARSYVKASSLSFENDDSIRNRFVADFTFLFNASFEPCLKYCLSLVGDRGMQKEEWTSWRLRKEVIYLEKDALRYELSRIPEQKGKFDSFRWARVLPSAMHAKSASVPLASSSLEIIASDLDWDEIEWGPSSVRIRGKNYEVHTLLFKQITAS